MNGESEGDAISELMESIDVFNELEEISDELRQKEAKAKARERYLTIQGMQYRYNMATKAKIGSNVQCACCGTKFIKTTYHKKFCSNGKTKKGKNNCKDIYWNTVDDTRRERATFFNSN